jgi:hypothetical protein
MKAPLTTAAFTKAGVNFGTAREETAAGFVDATKFSIRNPGKLGTKADILNWMLMHRQEWPAEWDDSAVAARLTVVLTEFAPRAADTKAVAMKSRDVADRSRYQDILRAAQAALFQPN